MRHTEERMPRKGGKEETGNRKQEVKEKERERR
jgi:hypothetical protein